MPATPRRTFNRHRDPGDSLFTVGLAGVETIRFRDLGDCVGGRGGGSLCLMALRFYALSGA